MAGYGWSYLVVTMSEDQAATPPEVQVARSPAAPAAPAASERVQTWIASDASTFTTELEMFRELGVTGWELIAIRETRGQVHYYFKRARA